MDGLSIFAIMNNNMIETITSQYSLHNYISGIKYKKIKTSHLYILALTKDNKVKCISYDPTGIGIIPENFIDVEDILFKTDLEIPYIIKKGKEIPLFASECEWN